MKLNKDYAWAFVGLAAVLFSGWLLYGQLREISLDDILASLEAIPLYRWGLAALATVAAYAALAGYDRIALAHLGRKIRWGFIAACSFTTYALAHNIGASVFAGALVRYRAYTSKGMSGAEVGVLVAFCSITFAFGVLLLAGLVLLLEPSLVNRFYEDAPSWLGMAGGALLLSLVGLYVLGSWLGFRPLKIRGFELSYPRLPIVTQQLLVGPLELLGAAGIIYFALPEASNPGFLLVLGIFLASFSAALLSHAPGGLGVLEVVFLIALPDVDPADVIAALLVFRLFYLLIPFALSLVIVLMFERAQLLRAFTRRALRERRASRRRAAAAAAPAETR